MKVNVFSYTTGLLLLVFENICASQLFRVKIPEMIFCLIIVIAISLLSLTILLNSKE